MVIKGDFTLELVHAESKVAFKEHRKKDGRTYAEIKPDVEYFLKVSKKQNTIPEHVLAFFEVDGKSLGYGQHLKIASPQFAGCWNRVNGIATDTALKFSKKNETKRMADEKCSSASVHDWTGCVTAKFYKAVDSGKLKCYDSKSNLQSTWRGDYINISKNRSKQGMCSVKGSITNPGKKYKGRVRKYLKGELLEKITIHYCTAHGLVKAGVIPKPISRNVKTGSITPAAKRRRINVSQKPTIVTPLSPTEVFSCSLVTSSFPVGNRPN